MQPTRKLRTGRAPLLSYLVLLRAEFGCFHSSSSLRVSHFQLKDQCPGHSLCSTVPHLTVEGRYPLRCHLESGLSSQPEGERLPVHPRLPCITIFLYLQSTRMRDLQMT